MGGGQGCGHVGYLHYRGVATCSVVKLYFTEEECRYQYGGREGEMDTYEGIWKDCHIWCDDERDIAQSCIIQIEVLVSCYGENQSISLCKSVCCVPEYPIYIRETSSNGWVIVEEKVHSHDASTCL